MKLKLLYKLFTIYPFSLLWCHFFFFPPLLCWDGAAICQCPGSSPGDVLMLVVGDFLGQLDAIHAHFQAADC